MIEVHLRSKDPIERNKINSMVFLLRITIFQPNQRSGTSTAVYHDDSTWMAAVMVLLTRYAVSNSVFFFYSPPSGLPFPRCIYLMRMLFSVDGNWFETPPSCAGGFWFRKLWICLSELRGMFPILSMVCWRCRMCRIHWPMKMNMRNKCTSWLCPNNSAGRSFHCEPFECLILLGFILQWWLTFNKNFEFRWVSPPQFIHSFFFGERSARSLTWLMLYLSIQAGAESILSNWRIPPSAHWGNTCAIEIAFYFDLIVVTCTVLWTKAQSRYRERCSCQLLLWQLQSGVLLF